MALTNQLYDSQPFDEAAGLAENTVASSIVPDAASSSTGQRQVNPQTDTVEGRMAGLLSKDSALMQRAETKGKQYANSRGLLNSSIGAGAAQAAMVDAAMPIAQQDASTYFDQGTRNQDYRQASEQNALQRTHEIGMADADRSGSIAMERLRQSSGLYAQFLQGMSDINAADMDQGAKDIAMSSLWDAIQQGTSMASALSGVTFENGNLVHSGPPGTTPTLAPTPSPRSNTTSTTWGDGGIYTPGVTRDSRGALVDRTGNTPPVPAYRYELNRDGDWVARSYTEPDTVQ